MLVHRLVAWRPKLPLKSAIVITAFLALAVTIGAVLLPIMLLRGSRNAYLSTLGKDGVTGLTVATASLWDAPPQWQVLDAGKTAMIDGRRAGEAIDIKVVYGENSAYVNTGYKEYISGKTTVTIGLRGAKPKLELVQKDKLANFVEQRFDGDTESDLLDDETKQAIIDYAVMVPMLEKIEVTEQGLSIKWAGSPSQKTAVANDPFTQDVKRTVELAERLQKRILGTIERRVAEEAHVRVDAYRDAGTDAEEEEEAAREGRA